MCGIVGYVGPREAAPILLEGLARLEYRGYDSAGLSVLNGHGLETRKLAGRVAALGAAVARAPLRGACGIAHTRWATHGAPTERNAHPHGDCAGTLALVHNGIIENADVLRGYLARAGHKLVTDTDTETLVHLIEEAPGDTLEERVRSALHHVVGTYGVAVLSASEPGKIVAARRGSPVLLGVGEGEPRLTGLNPPPNQCESIRPIVLFAWGTSWHAGLVGRHVIEELAGIPVEVEYASESRYRRSVQPTGTLAVAVSQSGETADTLEALR